MTWLLVIAVVAVALFALAWWSSGRARVVRHHDLLLRERGEAEVRTMRQYRPNGGNGPGPVL